MKSDLRNRCRVPAKHLVLLVVYAYEDAPRDAGPDREWAKEMTQSSRAAPVTPAAALCHPLSRGVGVVRVAARVLSSMKRIWLSSRSLWLSPYRYLPLDAVDGVGVYVLG